MSVHHWNDTLFSFETTRKEDFRFRNGEFVMVGLEIEEKPLLRAYSIASSNREERLEFHQLHTDEAETLIQKVRDFVDRLGARRATEGSP